MPVVALARVEGMANICVKVVCDPGVAIAAVVGVAAIGVIVCVFKVHKSPHVCLCR